MLLGGGKGRFDQTIDGGPDAGRTVVQSAERQGDRLVTDAAGLAGARADKPLLGLFNAGNMSLEWSGALAAPFPGSGPQRCAENQRPANEPSLSAMTSKAIDLLTAKSRGHGNRGFLLQVEGASIDKQDHAENPAGRSASTSPSTRPSRSAWTSPSGTRTP